MHGSLFRDTKRLQRSKETLFGASASYSSLPDRLARASDSKASLLPG